MAGKRVETRWLPQTNQLSWRRRDGYGTPHSPLEAMSPSFASLCSGKSNRQRVTKCQYAVNG